MKSLCRSISVPKIASFVERS